MERGEGFEGAAEWKEPSADDVEAKRQAINEVLESGEEPDGVEFTDLGSTATLSGEFSGHFVDLERKRTSNERNPYTYEGKVDGNYLDDDDAKALFEKLQKSIKGELYM